MELVKKRIEFIDLAKGVCILMVIITHITYFEIPGLQTMRMPLYYILSGLFFKDYGGLIQLLLKKVNKLLIPFLFFYISSYLLFYLFNSIEPGLIKTEASGIFDVFTQRQWFNGPVWFLLSLFWLNLMFGIISLNVKNEIYRCIVVLIIGCLGGILAQCQIFTPCVIGSSMTAFPFFYLGYILKKTSLLYPNKYDRFILPFSAVLFLISIVISKWTHYPKIGFYYNEVSGSWIANIVISICSVFAVLFLCKMLKRLPFVSYFGRYSIIPLCTHHLIYRPVKVFLMHFDIMNNVLLVVITILICWACIPLCRKYLPYVTAQKDLIKI